MSSKFTRSRAGAKKPMQTHPNTSEDEPILPDDCESRRKPRCRKSETNTAGPSLAKLLGGTGGSRCKKSRTKGKGPDQPTPKDGSKKSRRAGLRRLRDGPMCKESRAESSGPKQTSECGGVGKSNFMKSSNGTAKPE